MCIRDSFGTKARLLEELIRHTQQFDFPDDAPTGLGRLSSFVAAYLGGMWDRSPRSEAFLKLWAEAAGAEPALAPLFIERDAAFKASLAQYIRDGQADGSIRGDARPETAALAIIGQLRGAAMLAFSTARDVPIADLTTEVLRLVEQGLAAR